MALIRLLLAIPLALIAAEAPEHVRQEILATYQTALDALRRGDAGAALRMETPDWVSITVGQKPRTLKEMEPLIRRDIAGMKPPPNWSVTWLPDYEKHGTTNGIQIYDLKLNGNVAVVLCLVGSTHNETTAGVDHSIWSGSQVRDTWIKTPAGWKRRMHEKLSVNERMVDGHSVTP